MAGEKAASKALLAATWVDVEGAWNVALGLSGSAKEDVAAGRRRVVVTLMSGSHLG